MTDSAFWQRMELVEGKLQELTTRQEKTIAALDKLTTLKSEVCIAFKRLVHAERHQQTLTSELHDLTAQGSIIQARLENVFNCLALLHQALSGAVGTGDALKRIQREMDAIHMANSKGETWSLPNESPDAPEKSPGSAGSVEPQAPPSKG